jgi:hypothetical protein
VDNRPLENVATGRVGQRLKEPVGLLIKDRIYNHLVVC